MLVQYYGLLKQQDCMHPCPDPLTLDQLSVVHAKLHKPRCWLATAENVAP